MRRYSIMMLLVSAILLSAAGTIWSQQAVQIAKVTPADTVSSAPSTPAMEKKINVEMKDTTLDEALKVLLGGAGMSYRIDPDVAKLKVTAVLKNVSLSAALQEIVKASGTAVERQNNVWHIMARQPAFSTLATELERKLVDLIAQLGVERQGKPEDHPDIKSLRSAIVDIEKRIAQERKLTVQHTSPGSVDAVEATVTRIFTIQYINPAELVPLIYALGARQVSVVSGGKLVVNASEQVLAEAGKIIEALDTEEALPRPVDISILAEFTYVDDEKQTESVISTSGSVPEGMPIMLHGMSELVDRPILLDVSLVPEIGVGDRVSLGGNVSIALGSGADLPDGPSVPLSTSPVAVMVVPGEPLVIASGAVSGSGGKLQFEVTAKVTIKEGRLKSRTGGGGFNVPGMGNFGGFGGGGMGGFGAAMNEAATQLRNALDVTGGFGGGMGNSSGGQSGQDAGATDGSSGGGGH